MRLWRPPPQLLLDEWADRYFYLSAESSAEPGRWKTLPYQRGIMRALTDPTVERVTWMKAARVGATKLMGALIAYHMVHDPCPIMLVQPTVEDAEGYSKDEIAPMLRDVPVLAGLVAEPRSRDSDNRILHKSFPGGRLMLVGGNSGRGFRRVSVRVLCFDEVDGMPPSAGSDGDQIRLGTKRTEYYANRKIYAASTPMLAGSSRIEDLYLDGDQRRYFVPCPLCGVLDVLEFRQQSDGHGHFMSWPTGSPGAAHFVCSACSRAIEHRHKRDMVEAGEWQASGQFAGHASFHLWAAYSYAPNATWARLAEEFVSAEASGPEQLKTYVNTTLAETWRVVGEAPEWRRLHDRRADYDAGTVPAEVELITCGVDVQKERLVYEVVGWGANRESWSIDAGLLMGDTSSEDNPVWQELTGLLGREWKRVDGVAMPIAQLAVDSGFNTQVVYAWVRRWPPSRVMACKGTSSARAILAGSSPVDVRVGGKRLARGVLLWSVGVSIAKTELYGWLRLDAPGEGVAAPAGYCHFAGRSEEFFRQLTAEQLVTVRKKTGHTVQEWQKLAGRENHWLDARVLARAAAARAGIDRVVAVPMTVSAKPVVRVGAPEAAPPPASAPRPERPGPTMRPRRPGWLGSRGSWLSR
jgi:phage terminase large subunit GpA-like protein